MINFKKIYLGWLIILGMAWILQIQTGDKVLIGLYIPSFLIGSKLIWDGYVPEDEEVGK